MKYQPTKENLKGKVILVTGVGAGIGRSAALTYARHGARVILVSKTTTRIASLFDAIAAESLPEAGIAPLNFASANAADMQALADVIATRYGRLDGIVHNAAILGERAPFEHCNMNTWMEVMQVNLTSVCLFTRILIPLIRSAPRASIVFTSSSVGHTPKAYWGAYAVSKYGLEGFAKLLAEEFENTSAIRVNILNPGATRTAMRAAAYPTEDPSTLRTPEELMRLYLYLMDDASSAENGRTFTRRWLETATG